MANMSFDYAIEEYMIDCRSRQLRPKSMNFRLEITSHMCCISACGSACCAVCL